MDEYKNIFMKTPGTSTRTKTEEIVTEGEKTFLVTTVTTVDKRELTSADVQKRKEKLQSELTKLEVQEKAVS